MVEAAASGWDTVRSSLVTLDLANYANVENVQLLGSLALNATGNSGSNWLTGSTNSAANVLTGLGGNDTYNVGVGDTIVEAVGGGTDMVRSSQISLDLANYANVENMQLLGASALSATGNSGDNVVYGSTNSAANTLTGLGGNDTYDVGSGDVVVEAAASGWDTVRSSLISLDLANYANVENVQLMGSLALSATGNSGANWLTGSTNSAANVLTGLGGNDTYNVGAGDTIVEAVGGGIDMVSSSAINLDLANYANVENMQLTGNLGNLTATGNNNDNVLHDASIVGILVGLGGNDTYDVGPFTQIHEETASGWDTVRSSQTDLFLIQYPNVENLQLLGSLPLNATGNSYANWLTGSTNSAANVLTGLGGNDTYNVGAGDTIVEAIDGGTDTVRSSSISLDLANYANVENIQLTGALALSATGDAIDNSIDGSTNSAANILTGGGGFDYFIVGAGDTIVEDADFDRDRVASSLISLDLANYANVEGVVLLGSLALSATGNDEDNGLNGESNSAANVLTGLDGDDVYGVGAGDTIVEAAGGGSDTVQSEQISLDLANYANVENINLFGSLALSATGNNGDNFLGGLENSAANVLTGLGGNDTYYVGLGDIVVEAVDGGRDQIWTESIGISLANYSNVEDIVLVGDQPLSATGNDADNVIQSNEASNILGGDDGADLFILRGALGPDNVDSIVDFQVGLDLVGLSNPLMPAAGPGGTLDPNKFHVGSAAADASDVIIYNSATGGIFYDPDGTGAAAMTQFATVSTGLALTHTSFWVLA